MSDDSRAVQKEVKKNLDTTPTARYYCLTFMNTDPNTTATKKRSGRTKGSTSLAVMTIRDVLATGKLSQDDPIPFGRKFLASRGINAPAQYARAVYAAVTPALTPAAAPAAPATDGAPQPKVNVIVTDLDAVVS